MNYYNVLNFIIGALSSSIITIITLFWIFVKYPEKIEKWVSMFFRMFAFISEKAEKHYMATDIQSTISTKRKELGLGGDVLSYGISIKWTDEESVEVDLKESKVVVMMRPHKSQAKNISGVVSVYVPRALLPESRRYVDDNLMVGMDYTISKTILKDNPIALNYFVEREIEKHTDVIKKIIESLEPLDEHGHLTRVLIPELQGLSNLHPLEPNIDIFKETKQLTDLLYRLETAEPGEVSEAYYTGIYIKMGVVRVGIKETLTFAGIEPHLNYIKELLSKGVVHIYIVSANPKHNVFAKLLSERACKEHNLSLLFSEDYEGKFRRRKRKMYCALCIGESLV